MASTQEVMVVMFGDGGVGKSTSTVQFIARHFVTEYDPTIEDCYRKQINVDDTTVMIEVLDTAGPEEFPALREQWIRTGDAFVVMYAVNCQRTLDGVQGYVDSIRQFKETSPVVVVGNKTDLEGEREVSVVSGGALAKELNCFFAEASAKLYETVEDYFLRLVKAVLIERGVETKKAKPVPCSLM